MQLSVPSVGPPNRTQVIRILGLIIFAPLAAGCVTQPGAAPATSPTSIARCLPGSVFTAEDMRARVDCHPDNYTLRISQDTVVLYAFPDPVIDWVGPVFIIHIPSVSEAVVNADGTVFMKDYKSPEGRTAVEGVLNNAGLMQSILERATHIQQGTLVAPTAHK